MLNKMSKRKRSVKVKLEAASQEERINLWKRHFDNSLRKPPKVMHETLTKFISNQLDMKL